MRHAKSDWDSDALSDFDRPINERGRHAAERMGQYIRRECGGYTRALVSPATRCRETFEIVCEQLDDDPEILFEQRIYLASSDSLLDLVHEQDDACDTLLVVGHNPGITYLALELIREDDAVDERERIAEKFPTAGFIQLECDVTCWGELGSAGCNLKCRRYPIEEDA